MSNNRYPSIFIQSKNELAKHISSSNLSPVNALALINDVIKNFDSYWYDSQRSEPAKGKFVRSAAGTPLAKLLKLIDQRVLAVHDRMVPDFIFGGLSNKNHILAADYLLGQEKGRTLVGLDVQSFFEQIKETRVFYFFYKKCKCSVEASKLLAKLCTVPLGPKGSKSETRSIARGFATSSRLALWTNIDIFLKLKWKVYRKLKAHDPRIAIYVDDVGVSASRVDLDQMKAVSGMMEKILKDSDHNQSLQVNPKKNKLRAYATGAEHLGMKLGRNKLSFGAKTRSKRDRILDALKSAPNNKDEKTALLQRKRSYHVYQKQIEKVQASVKKQ